VKKAGPGEMVFLLGFLAKNECWMWCFCGQFVVKSVANVDTGCTLF
jgi:hypothetical protein